MGEELLRLLHLRVKNGHAVYFSDLSFSLRRNETLGLTHLSSEQRGILLRYFSGALPQAEGQLFAFGQPVPVPFPISLIRSCYWVPSASTLVGYMSITENLFVLSASPHSGRLIRRRTLDARCQALIDRFGLSLDARTSAEQLSPFGRVAVELLKAVVFGASIIFYDRSLDTLTEREFSQFQVFLRSLCAFGCSIVLLWGQPERMLPLCNRITVIRDGVSIKSFPVGQALVDAVRRITSGFSGQPVLKINPTVHSEGALLSVYGLRLRASDQPMDLTIARGEIVCLIDHTFTDADYILRALYGMLPFSCFHYSICGRTTPTFRTDFSFANGMLLVRHLENMDELLPNASVRENIELLLLHRSAALGGIIRRQFLDIEIHSAAEKVGLQPEQLDGPLVPELLLRVHLARILLSHRSVLLLENPFNGLDPADAILLRHFLTFFAASGNCVLFSTTHLTREEHFCTHYYQVARGELLECKAAAPSDGA